MATHEPITVRRMPLAQLLRPGPYLRSYGRFVSLLRHNRTLTTAMAKREISTEHQGKRLGGFWGIFQPLFLLLVYAVVYGVVFRVRIGGTYELPRNYTIYLLSGLVPWFAFQLVMTKSTTAIAGSAHLVKTVVFKLDVLPVATALASCLSLLLGLTFLGVYTAVSSYSVPWTYVLLPVVVLLQFIGMTGFAFVLSSLGVFIRDIRDFVQLSAIVLIFLLPIVYLPSAVPAAFSPLLWLNPFTYMVYAYQDVLYYGRIQHPYSWLAYALWSAFVLAAGYRLFSRLAPHFADVL